MNVVRLQFQPIFCLFLFEGILPFFLSSYKKYLVQIYIFIALFLEVTRKRKKWSMIL